MNELRGILRDHMADVREVMGETLDSMGKTLDRHLQKVEASMDLAMQEQAQEYEARLSNIKQRLDRLEARG
ncbi:hypothetical protein [Thalassovita aquimarina]|uniref:Uncharacterized protein n=1 Tax=Thalassovita aquimarina TaxID=2785917 RepID=A0ABS5HMS1_9RHOB|nr:hypothetical protein [Thalassovita aquimarina]MBR9650241.1 hypothetical protein [Thalassovita aquimarina]